MHGRQGAQMTLGLGGFVELSVSSKYFLKQKYKCYFDINCCMKKASYVIGVDYGTDSVRSIIADTENGKEIASSVFYYPRWKDGLYSDVATNQFRQHPL